MSLIRRNPMNGIKWHPAKISSNDHNLTMSIMQNPNEPTFMIDISSLIQSLIRTPRIRSRALELCKDTGLVSEYKENLYIDSAMLPQILNIMQEGNTINPDARRSIMQFWQIHLEEFLTEYPRRDDRVDIPNSSEEGGDQPKECYFYAQYGECSDTDCKYLHPGADNFMNLREQRNASLDHASKAHLEIRKAIGNVALPPLSRRTSSFAKKRGRREVEEEEEFNPDEVEEVEEEDYDQEVMNMIVDSDEADMDEEAEDDVGEDYLRDPQRRPMQFDERQTLIHLNTQTISSLTSAGQYFMNRQQEVGERNYDRVLEEIDAGVTNAVNELQRMIPVGNQEEIQVQEVLGDEYLESAVRLTQRVTQLGYSVRELDNDEFRTMMKDIGLRASDLHKNVYGRKPKKVAMSVGRGGRKYFNYYSQQTAPRTLDVAIAEWFRNRDRQIAQREQAERQVQRQQAAVKRAKHSDEEERFRQMLEEMERDDMEREELIRDAENQYQPWRCPSCNDGYVQEDGECDNRCGYNDELEQLAEEQRCDQQQEIASMKKADEAKDVSGQNTIMNYVSQFFSPSQAPQEEPATEDNIRRMRRGPPVEEYDSSDYSN